MSRPPNVTVPLSGLSRPVTRLNSVVLPAPFGPMTLTSSPSFTDSDSALTAVTPPKRRVRFAMSISAAITPCPAGLADGSG